VAAYENTNGKAAARTVVQAGSKTFRIDFSDLKGGFDLLAVANVTTDRKAGELKVAIDAIKQFAGAPAVILVGHSLGGLAARSYMQGTGHDRNGISISYGRDVAALIMIDTPNQGSRLAYVSGFPKRDQVYRHEAKAPAAPANMVLTATITNRVSVPRASIISDNAGTDSDNVIIPQNRT
jgi:pimeloyl-ACP methyl ester carboxylesterase